jgi:hypothetical protein
MVEIAEAANLAFSRENIAKFNAEALAPGRTLVAAIESLGLKLTGEEVEFVSSLPAGQQEAIRAALYSAASRGVPATLAWAPGYDNELTIWESAGASGAAAMTILLRTPYDRR